jgi:hypothetical protein
VRARAPQLPELKRIKQSLHQVQVMNARTANNAMLTCWDPELDYDMQMLLSSSREVGDDEA